MLKYVFDFGAVVFRWRPMQLLQRELPALAADEASSQHWVAQFFQAYGGDWGDFDRGLIDTPELVRRIAQRTGLAEADVQRVVDGVPAELQPQPDTVDLMRRLRDAGHPLFYLSNMPLPLAEHLEQAHDFMAWFQDGVFSSRVKLTKPDPAIFRLAARRFDVDPSDLVFLDDHPANVHAARAMGWKALVFTDAMQAEAVMKEQGWM